MVSECRGGINNAGCLSLRRVPFRALLSYRSRSITSARRLTTSRDSRLALVCKIAALICRRTMSGDEEPRASRFARILLLGDQRDTNCGSIAGQTKTPTGVGKGRARSPRTVVSRKLIFTRRKSPRAVSRCQTAPHLGHFPS